MKTPTKIPMKARLLGARSALAICALLSAAGAAYAHDDDRPGTPVDPSAFAGAGKLIAAIIAGAVVFAIWYHLRRQAIIRDSRKPK